MPTKQLIVEGATASGDRWRVSADMEGERLGHIYLDLSVNGVLTGIPLSLLDAAQIASALGHTSTSIEWIKKHGLEPTYHGAPDHNQPSGEEGV